MSLFDAFLGKSQRRDIQQSSAMAADRYKEGLEDFTSTQNKFLDRSVDFLQPDIGTGRDAQNVLRAALGLDGPEAQSAFFQNFQTDPGFQAATQAGIDQLDNSAASRGQLFSGGQIRDVADYGARRMEGAFDNRLSRLQQLGQTGSTQATNAAQLTSQAGNQIAGAQFGTNQLLANNAINTGNAVAQTRSIPINNLLGIAGAAAKGAGAYYGAQ